MEIEVVMHILVAVTIVGKKKKLHASRQASSYLNIYAVDVEEDWAEICEDDDQREECQGSPPSCKVNGSLGFMEGRECPMHVVTSLDVIVLLQFLKTRN